MRFDKTYSPIALYHFDGDLLDYSGNGYDLTGGSPSYRHVMPGVLGLVSGTPARTVSDSALRLSGDFTLLALCVMRATPSAVTVAGFVASGETEAVNAMYLLRIENLTQLRNQQESGVGSNADFTSVDNEFALPSLNMPFLLAVRRINGVVSFWINGVMFGSPSITLTTPTGGTSAVLSVGGGTNQPELFGLKIIGSGLTGAQLRDEYNRTLGLHFGYLPVKAKSFWSGAPTADGATVVARLNADSQLLRLVATDGVNVFQSDTVESVDSLARFTFTGLDPDTDYTYELEESGLPTYDALVGGFRTAPAAGPASFMFAMAGDCETGANPVVLDAILTKDPDFYWHLGDMHYLNIVSNNPAAYHLAYNQVQSLSRQAALLRKVACGYNWDDHDAWGNDCDGTGPKTAAAAVYRQRVPHYPLVESSGAIYHTFTRGRVKFIVTDQRYYASPRANTDNSSKSILGSMQKAWFKNELSNSSGQLVVWICSRTWGGVPTVGADHWGGFTTERTELCDYIKANCPGRVVVLSADMHSLAIDDGSHHDFATGGGEPIKTFQVAPLEKVGAETYGGATYSEGQFAANRQFGTMEVTDTGGSNIDVMWRGFNSAGTQIVSYGFTVNL